MAPRPAAETIFHRARGSADSVDSGLSSARAISSSRRPVACWWLSQAAAEPWPGHLHAVSGVQDVGATQGGSHAIVVGTSTHDLPQLRQAIARLLDIVGED
jgi:hypothetical protein